MSLPKQSSWSKASGPTGNLKYCLDLGLALTGLNSEKLIFYNLGERVFCVRESCFKTVNTNVWQSERPKRYEANLFGKTNGARIICIFEASFIFDRVFTVMLVKLCTQDIILHFCVKISN